ncbi:two component sensor histidine kinase FecR/PupR [Komagataeibacter diospyri]|uniref:FecR family protein n=1 Tax=Komagataeibacter diospyri TaxID=1932662 RepID=UPI00113C4141|nr:FecR domain-containing protein [Komagataeibacter diospyri]GCE90324.1 two component sensor histidine kinase FecR/PupR [Komagataeibacter diospyri]
MTAASDHHREQADEEAINWVILLREEPDAPDVQKEFSQWLAASSHNQEAWKEITRTYQGLGQVAPATLSEKDKPSISTGVLRIGRNDNHRQVFSTRRRLVAGVMALAACVVLAPVIYTRLTADAMTGMGETSSLTLEDGSHVSMGPDTALRVAFGPTGREVTLLKGDAWFQVVHDASRPFRVSIGKETRVTDIGTAFEVRALSSSVQVQVAEGRVELSRQGREPLFLGAGDGAVVRPANVEHYDVPVADVASWRDGQLVVHDRPIREVVDVIRQYYRGFIVVRNGVGDQRVTGVFDLHDPMAALAAVAHAHEASVIRITPWVAVLSRA